MAHWLKIFLLSTIPIGELRVTIPLALESYGMSFLEAMLYSVAGVMLAVFIIFLLLGPVIALLRKIGFFDRLFKWLFKRTRDKHNDKIKLWGSVALVVISAIPIPVLGGAWTAALVAHVFNINRIRSFFLILIGTILSGFIVLSLTKGISYLL